MDDVEPFSIALDAGDRCDRCGAQAYNLARNDRGLELLFCDHHKEKHELGIEADGFTIYEDVILREKHLVQV